MPNDAVTTAPAWSAADKWTLSIAILALVVAVLAAVITWWQLRIERNAAGGRGVMFDVRQPWRQVVNGVAFIESRVRVELFGPGMRYQVALHLERDGHQLEPGDRGYVKLLESRKSTGCDDEPIVWKFEHRADEAADLWCVLSWIEPSGPGVWTHAYARKLSDPADLYEWRWYRTRRFRRRLQSVNLGIRPLGRWRLSRELHIEEGHGPFDLRFAPDQRPKPRTERLPPDDD